MDTINKRVLTPNLLDVDPNSPTAEKQYVHWRKNFDYFLEDALRKKTYLQLREQTRKCQSNKTTRYFALIDAFTLNRVVPAGFTLTSGIRVASTRSEKTRNGSRSFK